MSAIEGVSELQEERRKYSPEVAAQIDEFIEKLKALREGRNFPFTFEVEDPSGNSFVQNPNAPNVDVACVHDNYSRSIEDYQAMGFSVEQANLEVETDQKRMAAELKEEVKEDGAAAGSNMDHKKAVKTTKDEQDELLKKV